MLLGLAFSFAAVASLASVAGGWAVEANRYGRMIALAMLLLFGLAMLLPQLAVRLTTPIVAIGATLSGWVGKRAVARGTSTASSLLLGIATGLVWAPCAGPVLGVVLTAAALRGPSLETSLLPLSYGLGAASALAAGICVGGHVLLALRRSIWWGERLRQFFGASAIAAAAMIWLGLDTGPLARWSSSPATALEQKLLITLRKEPAMMHSASAEEMPALSASLASLLGARQWLNSPPLHINDLRRKVVLVNFWTYSCINCLRVLPYVRAWAETYGNRGLLVVGVHTPEFAFEKDARNVSRALAALGVTYPVAIDSDFAIWRAFGNQAWPALYVVGTDGQVRHHVLGEGSYQQTERVIRRLLSEASGATDGVPGASVRGDGPQAEADARNLRSGETYIGYAQTTGFASPEGIQRHVPVLYRTSSPLATNRWALAGLWTIGGEYATSNAPAARIVRRFHARDLHLVLASAAPDRAIRFRVTLDGAPPGADHGADVDAEGWGTVKDGRLYQMIRQTVQIRERIFEIEFFDAGVRAYAFTFG
jgi:cytochrome c biogenesis protein CcdA/thiol-disulfide isomerase/thioredoxin